MECIESIALGYFFTDSTKENLQNAVPALESEGYTFVEIFLSEKERPGESDLWWLHVEKIETHTPESLFKKNQKLYQFAAEHNLDSYDGMDVGPIGQ